ncbi:ABC transporter permease [Oceanibaculum sp.]|uniref:ABC transporter permease n=1 Tax=Oceanibaculum sp. TaxID=1903597 RepID=UPI002589A626|nr:ABC transporter permease [Oceanibaculum sp.]MCH2394102.1 ABC transporter permease [Oceanibaculum sp.]
MQAYIVRRLLQGIGVLIVMSFIIYGLLGLMPGDPIDLMIQADPNLTSADIARLKALYGLDRPILERYANWASAALSGDFGYSRQFSRPVLEVLVPRLGNTLLLMGASFVLAIAIALPLGVLAASRPGSLADRIVNLFCFAGISVPPFWLALLLIMLFAVTLGWLPAGGAAPAGMENPGLADRLPYLVLPVITLTLASLAGLTRYLRASLIEAMREDYIRTARAKGAGEARVLWRHGVRNALIPVVTILALDFGTLFSGALITETMFAQPGMGKLIYDAIMNNDYNLALVGLLFATLVTLLANLAADIGYAKLDPRISYA